MSLEDYPKLKAWAEKWKKKRPPPAEFRIKPELVKNIHKNIKWNEKTGKWRGIKPLADKSKEILGQKISRTSIYDILSVYPLIPKKPKRVYPEYKDFWKNPKIKEYQKLQTLQVRTLTTVNRRLIHLQEFWLALNRKNPMNWDLDDYVSLLQNIEFHDPNAKLALASPTKVVMENMHLISLRQWCMFAKPKLYLEQKTRAFTTKGHKRRSGRKLKWFLTPNEQARLTEAIDDLIFLTYCIVQLRTGSRFSGMMQITANDVNLAGRFIRVFETKTMKPWDKPIDSLTIKALREYMTTYKITGTQRLFPYKGVNQVNYRLKKYAKKAGIEKLVSSHILRHTFALMCSINDITLEQTAKLGGWDDPKTLMDFYFHIPEKKLRDAYERIDWSKPVPKEVMIFEEKIVEKDEE